MQPIFLMCAQSEEGRVYGRMLQIELEDAGYPAVMQTDGEREMGLALIDAACENAKREITELRARRIPFLVYGLPGEIASVDEREYLARPFPISALLSRIRERMTPPHAEQVGQGAGAEGLVLGNRPSDAAYFGQRLGLTAKEYALLRVLWEHAGTTVSRETLYKEVWRTEREAAESNVVDVCVRNLRRKLDDRFARKLICTVRGKGYRLDLRTEGEGRKA